MEDQKKTNTTCPIKAAKALTPRWMMEILDYDGLEIHPCRVESIEDGTTFIEQCEPEDAQFWSMYGHCKEGGVMCFEDFPRPDQARDFARQLLKAYPHLKEFGLLDCSGAMANSKKDAKSDTEVLDTFEDFLDWLCSEPVGWDEHEKVIEARSFIAQSRCITKPSEY